VLNNPRRPLEASGTSGMKAAARRMNVSILDGWWTRGTPDLGWAIGAGRRTATRRKQDRWSAKALYNLLENEIVPLFHDRDRGGLPRAWIAMMKASIRKLGAYFNTTGCSRSTRRRRTCRPSRGFPAFANDHSAARELAAWPGTRRRGVARVTIGSRRR